MDQSSLADRAISEGHSLIEDLSGSGFDVTAAAWLKDTEDGQWDLYIASKYVDEKGLTEAYKIVHDTVNRKPELWLSPFDVMLLSLKNPIAQDIIKIRGPRANVPTRYFGSLGNLTVDEAYFYGPLPPAAAATP